MKVANLVGSRFKEKPSDCVIDSHALMVRGGYMEICRQWHIFGVPDIASCNKQD